uniref:Uncharacterized protein n=1 Tax=Aegilops tauschii subsp. strangulata TaxID=200361 RepID=A0A453JKY6_AEGTS
APPPRSSCSPSPRPLRGPPAPSPTARTTSTSPTSSASSRYVPSLSPTPCLRFTGAFRETLPSLCLSPYVGGDAVGGVHQGPPSRPAAADAGT